MPPLFFISCSKSLSPFFSLSFAGLLRQNPYLEATPYKRPRPPFGNPDEGFLSFLTPIKPPPNIK